jgi:hypothetical protein
MALWSDCIKITQKTLSDNSPKALYVILSPSTGSPRPFEELRASSRGTGRINSAKNPIDPSTYTFEILRLPAVD